MRLNALVLLAAFMLGAGCAAVRTEPGVLAVDAVAERDQPHKLPFFEMYADEAAYRAHIASPHFRKYVEVTREMITARRLLDVTPVQLRAKTG